MYAVRGYKRNGRDDLCGTYVEVNLSRQHLWFYVDGELIVESDFVSGLPTAERETATGAFPWLTRRVLPCWREIPGGRK